MLIKQFFAASFVALASVAAASNTTVTAGGIQMKLTKLDLIGKHSVVVLNRLVNNYGSVTADDVVSAYNSTASNDTDDLNTIKPTAAFAEASQLVICQSFHVITLGGLDLNNLFVENANLFNKAQRNTLQEAFTTVNEDNNKLYTAIRKMLPVCAASLRLDLDASSKSLIEAAKALDPADASS